MRKILIFDLNYMGDMLMSSPAIRWIKENTGAEVDVVCYDFCVDIMRGNPYIDNIYAVKRRFPLWTAIEARRRNYDVVMQFNTSLLTNLLIWIAGRKIRLGYDYRGRGVLLNRRISIQYRTARNGNRVGECLRLVQWGFNWNE